MWAGLFNWRSVNSFRPYEYMQSYPQVLVQTANSLDFFPSQLHTRGLQVLDQSAVFFAFGDDSEILG